MAYVVVENALDQLQAPLRMEVVQALRNHEMQLVGQVVPYDNKSVYQPQYTCIRMEKIDYFFGELTAGELGVSYAHPSILNNVIKAGAAWNSQFRSKFPQANQLYLQSWLDFVLFNTALRPQSG